MQHKLINSEKYKVIIDGGLNVKNVVYKNVLKFVIEMKRKNMYKKALNLGFTHPEVVSYSQELDVLLNKYAKQVA